MSQESTDEITLLIDKARNGDAIAEDILCERVFSELYQIAKRIMPNDDTSMQPTILVTDLFIKLFRNNGLKKTENRRYFFSVAADQMRKMLIDHYRRKNRKKVGGDRQRESLDLVLDAALAEFEAQNRLDFGALNEALVSLREQNERLYEVVMQRFFVGLTIAQTAELLSVSESSVERDWRLARTRLYADLKDS